MPAQDRQLSVKQLLVALLSFLLLCGVGGGILAATAIPLAATTGTAANAVTRVFDDLPTEIDFTRPSEQSVILAADGSTIANFYAENRIIVTSENISQYLKDGAVAIEDERFYEHNGIDPQGLAGAAFNNLTGGALAGGSTITQQYVKNAMIEEGRINNDAELIASATERSIARKLNEARFAIAVENQMTKDEILTGYLNLAQFGPSQYGVEAAAQHYFSTSAKDVTLEQAAMLVGITQAPGRWDPINHPEDAKTRRDTVLGQMYNLGTITRDQLEAAVAVSIEDMLNVTNTFNGCAEAGISAYYCEYVVKEVLESELLGETREERVQELYRGGLTIKTTLDPVQQQAAYDAVVGGVPVGDPSSIEMAMSVVEPGTGQIKAMVQNTNFGNPTEDDPTATRVNLNVGQRMGGGDGFQSGSTFKVFTLIEWLDSGRSPRDRVNAANGQTFPSEEWTMSCAPGFATMPEPYAPKNIEGIGSGMMTVLDITRQSVNTGYVNMSSQLDVCDIVDKASALGVERGTTANAEQAEHYTSLGLDSTAGEPLPLEPNPSQVLGTNPVTPLSMANSMASLAAEGEFCRAYSFTEITNAQGEVLASQEPECRQVIDIDTARATTAVLEQVVDDNATGFRAQLQGGRPAAGKTGTANMDWHAWFMGYTPQLATAIWQGHMEGNVSMFDSVINGNYHLEVFGGLYPALAFKSFMDVALADEPIEQFQRPLRSLGSTSSFDQDSDESASDYDSEPNSEPDSDSDSDSDSNSDSDTDDNQNQSAVPNVVGMGPDEAGQILLNNGYGYAIGTDYSDLPPGVVARQSPGPNSNAAPGTIVNLWLSIGPDPNAG